MPLLPASLIEPLWVEFAALIGADTRPKFAPSHPWGCHRRRLQPAAAPEQPVEGEVEGQHEGDDHKYP